MLKNNTGVRKIITLLLALIIAAGMLPMTVRADEPNPMWANIEIRALNDDYTAGETAVSGRDYHTVEDTRTLRREAVDGLGLHADYFELLLTDVDLSDGPPEVTVTIDTDVMTVLFLFARHHADPDDTIADLADLGAWEDGHSENGDYLNVWALLDDDGDPVHVLAADDVLNTHWAYALVGTAGNLVEWNADFNALAWGDLETEFPILTAAELIPSWNYDGLTADALSIRLPHAADEITIEIGGVELTLYIVDEDELDAIVTSAVVLGDFEHTFPADAAADAEVVFLLKGYFLAALDRFDDIDLRQWFDDEVEIEPPGAGDWDEWLGLPGTNGVEVAYVGDYFVDLAVTFEAQAQDPGASIRFAPLTFDFGTDDDPAGLTFTFIQLTDALDDFLDGVTDTDVDGILDNEIGAELLGTLEVAADDNPTITNLVTLAGEAIPNLPVEPTLVEDWGLIFSGDDETGDLLDDIREVVEALVFELLDDSERLDFDVNVELLINNPIVGALAVISEDVADLGPVVVYALIIAIDASAVALVPPSNLTLSPNSGTVDVLFDGNLAAVGTPPLTWTLASGGLPPGLTVDNENNRIYGTPTEAGNFTFTIQAENTEGDTALQQFTIAINAAVPQTGIPGVTGFAVAGMSFAIAAGALWFVLLRRKVSKQEN